MKNKAEKYYKSPLFVTLVIATLLRISLSQKLSVWYPSFEFYDDQLLVKYANLLVHFKEPDLWSLVKNMSYPLFLNFVHLTGLSYSTVMALVWLVAALLVTLIFRELTKDKYFLSFVYLFVLFTPAAFDSWVGTRLYRNAIIAPFTLITFALMILIIVKLQKSKLSLKEMTFLGLFLGLVFTFTYYIKEDGFWLLPCLALTILVSLALVLYRYLRRKNEPLKRTLMTMGLLFLPLAIWFIGGNVYKMVNHHYFDVYEINTRTGGELGDFVSNVYKIDSQDRNAFVWAPADAIEKAFEASATLKEYPELKEAIFESFWVKGDILKNPINGDFLSWVLRTSLSETGIWKTEAQVQALFKEVNSELEEALESGSLKKDSKFQLTASAGGRNIDEIIPLAKIMVKEYAATIVLKGYEAGGLLGDYSDLETCEFATFLSNENLMPMQFENNKIKEFESGNMWASIIFRIYSLLNPALLLLTIFALISWLYSLVLRKKKKGQKEWSSDVIAISVVVIVTGISLLYAFGIAWFMEFIFPNTIFDQWTIIKFYSVGLVPMFVMIELFGGFLFWRMAKDKYRQLKNNQI